MTPGEPVEVEIRPFDRALVRRSNFSCGKPDLDVWLRQYAGQRERDNNTRTFLAVPAGGDRLVGYFATTTYRLEPSELSATLGAGKRIYPIPAVLLARLAVDAHWMGCGIGKQLLVAALRNIADASALVGFEVAIVDAIDDEAVTFYSRYGFRIIEGHSRRLFMTTADLRATFAAMAEVYLRGEY